jgi:methyl-accepting chemotaxis protein
MERFNNLSIKVRLILIMGFMSVLMLGGGAIGLAGIVMANKTLESNYKDRLEPTKMVGLVMLLMNENRAQVMLALQHSPDSPFSKMHDHPLTLHTDSIIKNRDKITAIIAEYKQHNLTPEEQALAEKFAEARAHYVKEGLVAAREALLAGDFSQTNEILLKKINPFYKTANAAADELLQQILNDAKTSYDTAITRYFLIRNIAIGGTLLGILLAIIMGILLVRSIAHPLRAVIRHFEEITKGNLSSTIDGHRKDEIGQVLQSLAAMQDKLNSILREVEDCGRYMGQSAYQVATISNEISEVSKQQENRSEEVSSAMRELHQISSHVQAQAIEASDRSRQVEALAREGIKNVQQNIGSMEEATRQVSRASVEIQELEQSAQHIHNIVNTIKEIAGQTNLLALNAAIEAARAGEQGRGFAVVADEVRKLAERTTNSAIEVSDIIEQLSGKVQQVAATMNVVVQKVNVTQEEAGETAHTIEGMASNAVETASANQGISSASHQQLDQFGLLQSTMETLFSILKESGAKVETTGAIGDDLRMVTGRLNNIMSGFTFNSGIVIEAAQNEHRRAPRAQNSLLVKISQGGGNMVEAVSSDFSLTGLRLRLPQPVNEREKIDLSLYLPNENLDRYEHQDPLRIEARVSWQRKEAGHTLCGVEFVNLDESKRNLLKKCFEFFHKNAEF